MTKCCTIDGVQSGIIWSVEQIIMGIAIINDIRLRGAGIFRDVGDSTGPHQFNHMYYNHQSISNIIRWNAGLLGRSSCRLMVQSLFDRLGIKQWVNGLAFEPFEGLINSYILLFLSYKKI